MNAKKATPTSVPEYIASAPAPTRGKLRQMRTVIRRAAPAAVEKIAWGMPGYYLEGPLVFFGAFRAHIGFFPTPSAVTAFKARLSKYVVSKGAVQFPFDKPIPVTLVRDMVRFRVREQVARGAKR